MHSLEFLEGIRKVAFSNPFAVETRTLQRQLGGLSPQAPVAEITPALHQSLKTALAGISSTGRIDREALTFARLYLILLDHLPDLDRYIARQENTPGCSLRFPAGQQMMERLSAMGYRPSEAAKRIAIMYQIRRAYVFLERGLIGDSPVMVDLRRRLWRNMFTSDIRWYVNSLWERMEDFSLLLLGETGCGKGAAAAAVGRSAYIPYDEATQSFVHGWRDAFQEINLSQFAAGVLESELFGHQKGAFTGAIQSHEGVFLRCPRFGSVFLDEMGDVPENIQIKLLRVLQERRFSPVGSRKEVRFEGRILAATHGSIADLRASGDLRSDFYYRVSSDCIEVPSLRARIEEDPQELWRLAEHLLARITGRDDSGFLQSVLERLRDSLPDNYPWPGNVRELEQALRRVLLTGGYSGDPYRETQDPSPAQTTDLPLTEAEQRAHLKDLYARYGTYAEVARITGLDRRTVKKYVRP